MLGASLLPSPSLAACLKGVAGGDTHSLALLDDGTVYAWGSNDYGQLGNGTTTNSFLPAPVTGLTGGSFLGGEQEGEEHSLALMGDGTVMAWGANFAGQLGNGTNIDSSVPVPVTGLTNVIDIAGHEWWSQALASDGTVWAWGHNFWGQLGDGSTTLANVPVRVVGLTSVVNIAGGGDFHAIALRSDGTVWSWGQGTYGALGNGTTVNSSVPVQTLTGGLANPVVAIAGGVTHSFALDSRGQVWSWGDNLIGSLGNGTIMRSTTPVAVVNLTNVTAISSGEYQGLALRTDGTVWAWGGGTDGQLGDGTFSNSMVPVQVLGLANVIAISTGDRHSMAVEADGSLWLWGDNRLGQLGFDPLVVSMSNIPLRLEAAPWDPIPGDQGNVLRAVKKALDVTLDFMGAPATRWRVYRDLLKTRLGVTALVPDAPVTSFTDPGVVPPPPSLYFYRLKGLSPCTLTSGP